MAHERLSENAYQDRPVGWTIIDEDIIQVLMLKLSETLQKKLAIVFYG
jgi:hypothetical protein